MHIEQVDPDDHELLDRVVAFHKVVDAVDSPWQFGLTARSLRVFLTRGWDGDPETFVVGTKDRRSTEILVSGEINRPTLENTDSAWLGAVVHPDHRRQGFGTACYDHLEGLAAEAGRTTLGTFGWDTPAATGFAEGRGYECRSVNVMRRLDLTAMPDADLDAIVAEAQDRAGAYELVPLVGPLPDDLLDAYLETVNAINDAPIDDLAYEDEVHDAHRLREYEVTQEERGVQLYRVLARHRDTGEIAGHTVLGVELDRPQYAEQHDTTVSRPHRGHRLGLLLKAEAMRWLRTATPDLRWVITQNAESNVHMIAVNERLGYQAMGRRLVFQRETSSHIAGDATGTA